jgi:hypothetical protein
MLSLSNSLLLLLTTSSLAQATAPTSLKNFTTGPLATDNSITLSLERYTAYYRGPITYYRNALTCANEPGYSLTLDDTYALEIGAVAPTQTKTTRAGYDSNPFWWNLAKLDDGVKNEHWFVAGVSSLDSNANKGNDKTGTYWKNQLSPFTAPPASSANSSSGYIVNGTYIWPQAAGAMGRALLDTCQASIFVPGELFYDGNWTMNGTVTPQRAAFSLVRNDKLMDGRVVSAHVFTFDGDWVVGSAKLLVDNGGSVQTEGIWEDFSATSGGKRSLGEGGLSWMMMIGVLLGVSGGLTMM